MINGDLQLVQTLVTGHLNLTVERLRLWSDIASKYLCDALDANDTGGVVLSDQVENGALFGIVDTKVAATTPQHPRGSFTPTRQEDPFLSYAQNRERTVAHVFRQRRFHKSLKKVNALARIVSHAFIKHEWDWRTGMPRFLVLSPLECWFDEAAEEPEDVSYYIHRRWIRKHEMIDLVKQGVYDGELLHSNPNPGYRDPKSRLLLNYRPDTFLPVYEVYEIHDVHDGSVYHWSPLKPMSFLLEQHTPEQLFTPRPFFCLSFNEYLVGQRGLSDGEVLRNPVERLSRLDALEYAYTKRTTPDLAFNAAAFTNPEQALEELTKPRQPGQILNLDLKSGFTWDQAFRGTPTPNLPMSFAPARNAANEDVFYRAGLPAYTRGQEGSKVATELALQQQSEATRRAWDVNALQDIITFCAVGTIALYEEFLPGDKVLTVGVDDGSGRISETQDIYRATLGFRDPDLVAYQRETGQDHEDGVAYLYTPEAYEDPMAGSPQSKIAQAQQLMEVGFKMGPSSPINMRYQAERLRRLLHEPKDFLNPEAPPVGPGQPGVPPGAGADPMAQAPGTDPVSAGGMPAGVPSIPTPAIGPMAGGAGSPTPTPKGLGIPGL